jgi:hypothetical protein
MGTGVSDKQSSIPESFVSSERDYLRSLCTDYSKETSALERYELTLAGLIWSWGVAHSTAIGVKALFFVPVLTTFLFGLRALAVYQVREAARTYLEELPKISGFPSTSGWEHYLQKNVHTLRVITAYAFWAVLQVITIVVGVVSWRMLP